MATYKPGPYTNVKPGKKVPSKPGAYRHVSKRTGKVVRQGETNNLNRRINEHNRSGAKYTSGHYQTKYKPADGRSTSRTRREHESRKIKQHDPPFNEKAGGGGRVAKGGSGRRRSR